MWWAMERQTSEPHGCARLSTIVVLFVVTFESIMLDHYHHQHDGHCELIRLVAL
jgi:hypothetical protein